MQLPPKTQAKLTQNERQLLLVNGSPYVRWSVATLMTIIPAHKVCNGWTHTAGVGGGVIPKHGRGLKLLRAFSGRLENTWPDCVQLTCLDC